MCVLCVWKPEGIEEREKVCTAKLCVCVCVCVKRGNKALKESRAELQVDTPYDYVERPLIHCNTGKLRVVKRVCVCVCKRERNKL